MIEINNLTKKYKEFYALDHINCVLDKKTYALLGPNGAGKTTLFRLITGVIKPTEGSIVLNSQEKGEGYSIGYLPQKFGVFKNYTVDEQMEYFVILKALRKKGYDWKSEIDRVLEVTNLAEHRKKKCGKLSGGMVRRLGIAQALLGNPDLILLDEPTTGLDIEECLALKRVLKKLEGETTIIMSTHVVSDVEALAQEILVISTGKLLAIMTPDEICALADGESNRLEAGYLKVIHHEE